MTNPSKQKGSAWERAVADYLAGHGFPTADRAPLRGGADRGDIAGVPFVVECKAERAINLAGYMDEVKVETANAGAPFGVAFVKRHNRRVGDGYAVMTIEEWTRIMGAAQ